MMSPLSRILLLLGVGTAFLLPASGQVAHIVGAPFTATRTFHKTGDSRSTSMEIARASNGSTYSATYDAEGKLFRVAIDDVPNNHRISFFVFHSPNDHNHTYDLSTPEDGFSMPSIEDVRQRLRRNQQHWTENPDLEKDNHHTHFIPLGEKPGDGMTLFGVRLEITDSDGEKHSDERWESDLGLMMSEMRIRPQEGLEEGWIVTNLRREEPDPSLFQTPKEYLSDPLLEAKTIFIDNQTGAPEILNGAIRQLNNWKNDRYVKPLAVVDEKNAADLTATLSRASVMDQGSITSGVRLQVYLREAQEPVFEVTVRSSGSQGADESAARDCFTGLRNRVANTHVGQRQPAVASTGFKPARSE